MSDKPRYWTPLMQPPRPVLDDDLTERDRALKSDQGYRNGMPLLRPYVWRPGDAEREAWVQAQVAAAKAQVRA